MPRNTDSNNIIIMVYKLEQYNSSLQYKRVQRYNIVNVHFYRWASEADSFQFQV